MIKTLQTVNNEFLADHKIGENAVLPTVCAIAWMADAAESIFTGYEYHGLENYKLFKGVVFDGSEASDYQIDLDLVDTANNGSEFLRLKSKVSSLNAKGKPVFHYGSDLILRRTSTVMTLPAGQLADDVISVGCSVDNDEAQQLYSNGTLFHGESLQGIKQVIHCDEKGLLLACQVPEIATSKQGDFPLEKHNVFANDLVYQAMLVWVRKELAMGSLPASTEAWTTYQQVNVNEAFYLQLTVVEHSSSKLIADISLISLDNKVLAEIKSAEVTISENLNDLFKVADASQSSKSMTSGL